MIHKSVSKCEKLLKGHFQFLYASSLRYSFVYYVLNIEIINHTLGSTKYFWYFLHYIWLFLKIYFKMSELCFKYFKLCFNFQVSNYDSIFQMFKLSNVSNCHVLHYLNCVDFCSIRLVLKRVLKCSSVLLHFFLLSIG